GTPKFSVSCGLAPKGPVLMPSALGSMLLLTPIRCANLWYPMRLSKTLLFPANWAREGATEFHIFAFVASGPTECGTPAVAGWLCKLSQNTYSTERRCFS